MDTKPDTLRETYVPALVMLFVGLALSAFLPVGGFWAKAVPILLALIVVLVGYWRPLKRTRLSVVWSVTVCLCFGLAALAVVRHETEKLQWGTATPYELLQPRVHGVSFRLTDLARGLDPMVQERVFEDCHIYGPGMIDLEETATVQRSIFLIPGNETGDAVVEIKYGQRLYGAIICKNCVFRGCTFEGVQFLMTADQKAEFVKNNPMRQRP